MKAQHQPAPAPEPEAPPTLEDVRADIAANLREEREGREARDREELSDDVRREGYDAHFHTELAAPGEQLTDAPGEQPAEPKPELRPDQALAQYHSERATALDALARVEAGMRAASADCELLTESDPRYAERARTFQELTEAREKITEHVQALDSNATQYSQAQQRALGELYDACPELTTSEGLTNIASWAKSRYGVTDHDLVNLRDPRAWRILVDNFRNSDEGRAARPEPERKGPPKYRVKTKQQREREARAREGHTARGTFGENARKANPEGYTRRQIEDEIAANLAEGRRRARR